jgi:hypothetical protein
MFIYFHWLIIISIAAPKEKLWSSQSEKRLNLCNRTLDAHAFAQMALDDIMENQRYFFGVPHAKRMEKKMNNVIISFQPFLRREIKSIHCGADVSNLD